MILGSVHSRFGHLLIEVMQLDPSSTITRGASINGADSTNCPSTPDMNSLSLTQGPVSHTLTVVDGWSPGSYIINGFIPKEAPYGVHELDAIPQTELLKTMAMLLEQITIYLVACSLDSYDT